MAKGQTIGLLNFGIGGDDAELQKIFAKQKKQAEELQALYKSIGFGNGKEQSAAYKSMMAERRKDTLAQARLDEAAVRTTERSLLAQQKLSTELSRTTAIREKIEADALMAQQRISSETQRTEAIKKKAADNTSIAQKKVLTEAQRAESIQRQSAERSLLAQQKLLTEVQRTEAAKKRAALVGVQGQRDYASAMGMTNKTMFSQYNLLQQLSQAAGIYFSIYQAGAFVKELAMVSGEFEKQRLSLAAIIQDQEASTRIFNQIKDLAVYSPFNFKELTDYAKQLSAFSIPTNEIFDTMKRLADISAGLGVDMNRIILAYGQVRSASVLRGQELRQFTEAGIPLVDELAKKFSALSGEVVKAGDVFDKISNREVPFAMIKEIFEDLTIEGGKFFNMQEIQARSLAGMISNLRDAYDIMLDSIGVANSEMMKGSVQSLVDVMENWEKYWNILKAIIATYGFYKAAIISVSIAHKTLAVAEMVTRFVQLTNVVRTSTAALAVLGKVGIATPLGAIAAAIGLVVGGLMLLSKEAKTTNQILEDLDMAADGFASAIDDSSNRISGLISTYNELSNKSNKNEEEQRKLKKTISELAKVVPGAANAFDEYGAVLGINLEVVKSYNEQQKQFARERLENQIKEANNEVEQLRKQQQAITNVIETGKVSAYGASVGYGGIVTTEKLSNEELSKYQNERADIGDKIALTELKIANARNALLGSFNNAEGNDSGLASFAVEINKQIDKLDIGEKLKNKLRIKDIDKDFQTIRKEAIETLEGLQQKLKDFQSAPSLFKPEDVKNLQESVALYQSFVNILGGVEKKETGGDAFTNTLKEQIELIKSAKNEYDKLLQLMSPDEATKTIKSIPTFSGIDTSSLTDEGYISALTAAVGKLANRTSDAARSARIAWNKELGQIEIESISNRVKYEVDEIDRYLSNHKSSYDFYRTILGITGDKDKAANIAFGGEFKSYINALKDAFRTDAGIEFSDFINLDSAEKSTILIKKSVQSLYSQILEAEKSEQERLRNLYTDSLKEYADYYDKRAAIVQSFNERIEAAEANNDKQLAESLRQGMESELLKLEPSYIKFFSSIYSLTKDEAVKIGNTIKNNLKKELDKGVISAEEYYDTIKKINAELKKSREGIDYFSKIQSGGPDGFLDAISSKADSDYQSASTDYSKYLSDFNKATEIGDMNTANIAQNNMEGAQGMMASAQNMQSFASKAQGAIGMVDKIVTAIDQSVRATQQLVDQFAELAESRGIDTESGNWANVKMYMETISAVNEKAKASWDSAKSGDGIGALANAVGIVTSALSTLNQWHDKKLNKTIEKSKFEVEKLENAYNDLERVVNRQLGSMTERQTEAQLNNLKKQRSELYKQRQAEEDKKKTDKGAIEDYNNQLKEISDRIQYFAEDLAKELYDIDIKSWAADIANSIVDAFASGEDAAKAFDKTVADIMRSVVQNMIALEVLEPAMQKVRDYLFGDNGVLNDGVFDKNDATGLVGVLSGLKDSITQSQEIFDYVNEAAKQVGVDLTDQSKKDTLGASIQALTESTGNLVASYTNAIRADLAQQKAMVEKIMLNSENNSTIFAQVLAKLVEIEINTKQMAESNSEIKKISEQTYTLLKNATLPNSTTKFNFR